jgi:Tfp pilus assembly protein PilF
LRKHYAVAGVVVAILVAALIVVAGSRSFGGSGSTADKASSSSTPVSRMSVSSRASAPTDYSAMVKLLAARYARNPSDSKIALALANAYLMTDQPTKARRLYMKVLAGDPGNEIAKVQLAMALHGVGDDDQAFELLNGVLRTDPRSQLAHYDLAGLYFSEQKSTLARDEWKKAAALDPTSGVGKMAQNFVNLMEESTGRPHPNGTGG